MGIGPADSCDAYRVERTWVPYEISVCFPLLVFIACCVLASGTSGTGSATFCLVGVVTVQAGVRGGGGVAGVGSGSLVVARAYVGGQIRFDTCVPGA